MVTKISTISSIVAMTALAAGYGLTDSWPGVLSVLIVWSLSLIGQRRGWRWSASVVLVCYVGAAVGGFWLQAPADLMLVGAVAALIAWDLARFDFRLRNACRGEGRHNLVRRHLHRLLIVTTVAFSLAELALRVRTKLTFGTAILAGSLAVLGLSRVVSTLRGTSD